MRRLIANLLQFDPEIDAVQIADILWLAQQTASDRPAPQSELSDRLSVPEVAIQEVEPPLPSGRIEIDPPNIESAPTQSDSALIATEEQSSIQQETPSLTGPTIRLASAKSLRKPIELERALRPLMRKVPSKSRQVLDEVATAERTAETRMKMPVVRAESQRWLDLVLVVEETSLTEIWRKTIDEFQWLLEHLGAFRDVRVWTMRRDQEDNLELFARHHRSDSQRRKHNHKELKDISGQRLILVLSDCTSVSWWEGKVHNWLAEWAKVNLVTVVQLLPQRLWSRGVLGEGLAVQLRTSIPGAPNQRWQVEGLPIWWTQEQVQNLKVAVTVPVVTLEPTGLGQWARAVSGLGECTTAGVLFKQDWQPPSVPFRTKPPENQEQIANQLVSQFRATASPLARRLAVLMAAVPVDLRVVELIQETMVRDSRQVHVAEVYLSGLLTWQTNAEGERKFQFKPGVRQELRKSLAQSEAMIVLNKISAYIAARLGRESQSFAAILLADLPEFMQEDGDVVAFAEIALDVLRQLGGQYESFAESTVQQRGVQQQNVPPEKDEEEAAHLVSNSAEDSVINQIPLQTQEVEVATIVFDSEIENLSTNHVDLQVVEFEVATLERQDGGQRSEWVIRRQRRQTQQWIEDLGNGIQLEMVVIPSGRFIMGSPKDERKRSSSEGPQHEVNVNTFFMGKCPVTQAQWKAVVALPRVNRKLEPDPSNFKGVNRPVEQVSWYDVVEFCDRLSQYTGREYCLPTEAEWEYACRAGTKTPFHFGETLITDLANYSGNYTYGDGPKGEYRKQTTPIDGFEIANAFGLSDMHGNVWEWCQDRWHDSYEGALTDGSAWLSENKNNSHLIRGGSWDIPPWYCRSAYRIYLSPHDSTYSIGFRVVCLAPRTP